MMGDENCCTVRKTAILGGRGWMVKIRHFLLPSHRAMNFDFSTRKSTGHPRYPKIWIDGACVCVEK